MSSKPRTPTTRKEAPGPLAGYLPNFETLKRAAAAGDLALLSCQDKATGKHVAVLTAVYQDEDGQYCMVPLAKLFDGDPYQELNPPNPDGDGYLDTEAPA